MTFYHPYTFAWINNPASLIIISGVNGEVIQGAKFTEITGVLYRTIKQMSKTIITIVSIVALAKVMSYSGMLKSIVVATAATGLIGAEGKIINATVKFCIVYVIILGLIAYFMGPIFGF